MPRRDQSLPTSPQQQKPKKQSVAVAKRPEIMTFNDALVVMCPHLIRETGKAARPRHLLPIDKVIKELKTRTKEPRLRSPDDLRVSRISDPVEYARQWTAYAVGQATRAVEKEAIRKKTVLRLKQQSDVTIEIARRLDDFLKNFRGDELAPLDARGLDRRDYNEINAALRKVNEALDQITTARKALKSLAKMAESEIARWSAQRKNRDIWGQTFCETMGLLWHDLTGTNPSSSSEYFLLLVQQAYASLCADHEPNFQNKIREAVERVLGKNGKEPKRGRPFWDRFDRMEKQPDPPGTIHRAMEQFFEEQKRRDREWKDEMREAVTNAKAGDPVASILVQRSYLTAGEYAEKFIEELGWLPSKQPLTEEDWEAKMREVLTLAKTGDFAASVAAALAYQSADAKRRNLIESLGWRQPEASIKQFIESIGWRLQQLDRGDIEQKAPPDTA